MPGGLNFSLAKREVESAIAAHGPEANSPVDGFPQSRRLKGGHCAPSLATHLGGVLRDGCAESPVAEARLDADPVDSGHRSGSEQHRTAGGLAFNRSKKELHVRDGHEVLGERDRGEIDGEAEGRECDAADHCQILWRRSGADLEGFVRPSRLVSHELERHCWYGVRSSRAVGFERATNVFWLAHRMDSQRYARARLEFIDARKCAIEFVRWRLQKALIEVSDWGIVGREKGVACLLDQSALRCRRKDCD